MSHEASGYVERHSPYRRAAFSVHRSIGEIANDTHSYDVWMTLRNLAAKSRVSLGAAKAAVDRMVADGFLIVLEAPTYRLPGRYRFVFKDDAPVAVPSGAPCGSTAPRTRLTTCSTRRP